MLSGYIGFALVFIIGEVLFHIMFTGVRFFLNTEFSGAVVRREVVKGILERLMLSVGIAHGIITVVIAFSALKVATKISLSANESDKSLVMRHNDYFIVGNVLSITFAIVYAIIARKYNMVTFSISG